jgi:hypothetical protein
VLERGVQVSHRYAAAAYRVVKQELELCDRYAGLERQGRTGAAGRARRGRRARRRGPGPRGRWARSAAVGDPRGRHPASNL